MTAAPRIEMTETKVPSLDERPPAANRGPSSFTRRKQILIGTTDKVNPTRTMARRATKISLILGTATPLYFWMIERIGVRDWTRFKVQTAADELGTNEKTVDRWLAKLRTLGFIKITRRKYRGQQTYSQYTLLPNNDIIQDDGHNPQNRGTKLSPGPKDKAVPTKRAYKTSSPPTVSSASSRSSRRSATIEDAEAGRSTATATAPSVWAREQHTDAGFDRDDTTPATPNPAKTTLESEITTWLKQNAQRIEEFGFAQKSVRSTCQDLMTFITRDHRSEENWKHFREDVWPRLQITLGDYERFFNNAAKRLGFGWLFRPCTDKDYSYRFNYELVTRGSHLANKKYDGFRLDPKKPVRLIGEVCWDRDSRMNVRVSGYCHTSYIVYAASIPDPSDDDKWPVHVDAVSDEKVLEGVPLASEGTSEPRDDAEAVPRPSKDEDSLDAAIEELLAG